VVNAADESSTLAHSFPRFPGRGYVLFPERKMNENETGCGKGEWVLTNADI
jgi:hypothetical protein